MTVRPPSGICATVPSQTASASLRTQTGSAAHAARREPGDQRQHDRAERDHAVAELDERVAALLGERRRAAAAASCRSRDPTP